MVNPKLGMLLRREDLQAGDYDAVAAWGYRRRIAQRFAEDVCHIVCRQIQRIGDIEHIQMITYVTTVVVRR